MTDAERLLRAELAETRAEAEVRLLILAMTPYLISNSHLQPPLWTRHRTKIPAPRVTPEGVRHARSARPR